jgi:hypothetical protein
LVWKADTATMNPKIDPAIIAEAYDSDPEAARAEYGAEFRDDLADYITERWQRFTGKDAVLDGNGRAAA